MYIYQLSIQLCSYLQEEWLVFAPLYTFASIIEIETMDNGLEMGAHNVTKFVQFLWAAAVANLVKYVTHYEQNLILHYVVMVMNHSRSKILLQLCITCLQYALLPTVSLQSCYSVAIWKNTWEKHVNIPVSLVCDDSYDIWLWYISLHSVIKQNHHKRNSCGRRWFVQEWNVWQMVNGQKCFTSYKKITVWKAIFIR